MAGFQHGLFGCFDNCCVCLLTYFVPCYVEGKIAEKVGESCILHGILMLVPIANIVCGTIIRGKVREQRSIEGSFIMDLLMFWCCACCSLAQEAQEVNALGDQSMVRE